MDVEVAVTSEELEAEVVRSRLEAEGIPSRIAPRSQIGMPASWSPRGLGYGIGSFSVRVPREYVRHAREVIADADRRPSRSRTSVVVRVIATVLLIYLLMGMAISLAQLLPQL